jgi:osmotically-inducible protein OsmY
MPADGDLTQLIKTTLLTDPRLSGHAVRVSVQDGRALLQGNVQSYRRKLLAHEIVGSIEGVHSVVNKLEVAPPDAATDEEIARSVRDALKTSADVTKETIQVAVTSGKVTLQGTVASRWEQSVADDIARGVRGVRDVVNLLVVDLESKVDDEELANAIKAAVKRTRGLTQLGLNVAVAGKLVTLSGPVAHAWQRDAAESVVRQFGLLHVRNEIQVRGPAEEEAPGETGSS